MHHRATPVAVAAVDLPRAPGRERLPTAGRPSLCSIRYPALAAYLEAPAESRQTDARCGQGLRVPPLAAPFALVDGATPPAPSLYRLTRFGSTTRAGLGLLDSPMFFSGREPVRAERRLVVGTCDFGIMPSNVGLHVRESGVLRRGGCREGRAGTAPSARSPRVPGASARGPASVRAPPRL